MRLEKRAAKGIERRRALEIVRRDKNARQGSPTPKIARQFAMSFNFEVAPAAASFASALQPIDFGGGGSFEEATAGATAAGGDE